MTTYRNSAVCARAEADLTIETTRDGEAVLCTLGGDLHLGNDEPLRAALARALGQARALLAVDLSAVALFTSSSLNALLTARSLAIDRGVRLVVVAPSRTVRRVLRITGADRALPVHSSYEEARRSGGADA